MSPRYKLGVGFLINESLLPKVLSDKWLNMLHTIVDAKLWCNNQLPQTNGGKKEINSTIGWESLHSQTISEQDL